MKLKITLLFTVLVFVGTIFTANGQINNTFTGEYSGVNNTGSYNTGYGFKSLMNNTSHSNSAFGWKTLSVSTGGFNCAFGNEAMASNETGTLNAAFGTRCLSHNISGSYNIAIGHRTLEANIAGSYNTAVGYFSLLSTAGNRNIALGYFTPRHLETGDNNIFIGTETAINLMNGSSNVLLGNRIILDRNPSTSFLAGNDTSKSIIIADGTGSQRIFVSSGGNTGIGLGNNIIPVNKLDIKGGVAIGKNFTPNGLAPAIVAPVNGLIVEGNVGIGTNVPNNKLEIKQGITGKSGLRFTNLTSNYIPISTAGTNKFLSVDLNGDVVLEKMANAVETNVLSSNVNLMTSNVNGISSSSRIVNSISNAITSSNQLITTVNGVASTPVNLPDISHLDNSATNELQTLNQSGNTVTLSNGGGSFTLPSFTDTDGQSLALAGNTLSISNGNSVILPSQIPQILSQTGNTVTLSNGGGSFTLPTFADTDGQSLALTGNVLSISNGNSVMLPSQAPQTLSQTGNTVTLSNGGGSFSIPNFSDTDGQTLSLTGNVLSISNGNSIVLPNHGPQNITQNGAIVTLSNGGGSITLQSTTVTAGTNVSILGNGSAGTPYVVSATDTSLYDADGVINAATTTAGNRVVQMNNSNIWFNSNNSSSNGKIYIGATAAYPSTTGNYKLFVEGGILTEKVKVALRSTANWADYVFEKNYDLMPLKNVEEYIAIHKHLPGIESASELSKNGLDLAEMQAKHMAKIEEMMLYIIEQNKTIEKNIKDIEELKKQVKVLTANED